MSHAYKWVQWTPFKKIYDLTLFVGIALYLVLFVMGSWLLAPSAQELAVHPVQMLMRALGSLAFGLLTLILVIGPLARLSRRFLPLLYNRRHLGVVTFLIALAHAGLSTIWYHGFSELNPLLSLLISNPRYDSIGGFPFESLGLVALILLFLMAATSHDFWNAILGPRIWKALHMSVYLAYILLIAHILLGALQQEKAEIYMFFLAGSVGLVAGLHLLCGLKENIQPAGRTGEDWLNIGPPNSLEDGKALIVNLRGQERVAIFRDGNQLGAISNLCRHQNGPLGEEKSSTVW